MSKPISDEILEVMCRAHDEEDAAQRGEPSPWFLDDDDALADHGSIFGDTVQRIEGYEAFRAERVAAMRCAIAAVPCMLCALGFAPFKAEKIMWHQINGRDPFRCIATDGPDGR